MKKLEFLKKYWRQRRAAVFIFCLCAGIFAISFLLYRLPVEAALYPALLCTLALLGLAGWDVYREWKKHLRLEALSMLPAAEMEDFPRPETVGEEDYRHLIEALRRERRQSAAETAEKYADMTGYYTLWVHQIKTPIAAMGLILQNEDSGLARRLEEELFRIGQYVEMALTYCRLESSSTDYVIRECELDGIVKTAVKRFASQFIRKKLRLEYEPLETRVLTDEKWLCFVLEQILSNALKYTPSGCISITLEAPKTLCIRDTGIGIAPEDLPRIFEMGYTGFNGRADKKASGIGLYLCRRICRNLGHTITVSSVLGRGTTVRLELAQGPLEVE